MDNLWFGLGFRIVDPDSIGSFFGDVGSVSDTCIHRVYKMNTSMFADPVSSTILLIPMATDHFGEFCEGTVDVNFSRVTPILPNGRWRFTKGGAAYRSRAPKKRGTPEVKCTDPNREMISFNLSAKY